MAETKKKVPKDTKLKPGQPENYASSTIKGKGDSKKEDIKKFGMPEKKGKKAKK